MVLFSKLTFSFFQMIFMCTEFMCIVIEEVLSRFGFGLQIAKLSQCNGCCVVSFGRIRVSCARVQIVASAFIVSIASSFGTGCWPSPHEARASARRAKRRRRRQRGAPGSRTIRVFLIFFLFFFFLLFVLFLFSFRFLCFFILFFNCENLLNS